MDVVGKRVIDPHGYRVGKVRAVFEREGGERAYWACVRIGVRRHSLVPLHDAQDDDGRLRVVYEKEHVKAAPKVVTHGGTIGDEDTDALSRHYGLERVIAPSGIEDDDIELRRETREAKPPDLHDLPPAGERQPIPE